MTTSLTVQLRKMLLQELTQNILPYWMIKMKDLVNGGFYGKRDGYDVLQPDADKAIVLNTRILWTFARAAREFVDTAETAAYRETADRAYLYLQNFFIDPQYGGVYWMVNAGGKPVNTKKQIYAQAFAIYALTEYFLATDDHKSLQYAKDLYKLVEAHSFDRQHNGYLEAFDQEWNLLDDLRLSDKDANEKKTMNTHLHLLEAYTNLYRCWPAADVGHQLRNLIQLFLEKIIDDQQHFQLFFDERWNVKSAMVSFGHDIEGSWLLQEAAEVLGDEQLIRVTKAKAVVMTDTTIREGMDIDGGLMNERHGNGSLDRDKHWWPQAEALVGFVNAWQNTGSPYYLEHAARVWQFIEEKLIDREAGEWFWRVDANGSVIRLEEKAGPWKCPYHNGRALLELLSRLEQSGV